VPSVKKNSARVRPAVRFPGLQIERRRDSLTGAPKWRPPHLLSVSNCAVAQEALQGTTASGTKMTINVIHIPPTKKLDMKLEMSLVLFPLVDGPFVYFLF